MLSSEEYRFCVVRNTGAVWIGMQVLCGEEYRCCVARNTAAVL